MATRAPPRPRAEPASVGSAAASGRALALSVFLALFAWFVLLVGRGATPDPGARDALRASLQGRFGAEPGPFLAFGPQLAGTLGVALVPAAGDPSRLFHAVPLHEALATDGGLRLSGFARAVGRGLAQVPDATLELELALAAPPDAAARAMLGRIAADVATALGPHADRFRGVTIVPGSDDALRFVFRRAP